MRLNRTGWSVMSAVRMAYRVHPSITGVRNMRCQWETSFRPKKEIPMYALLSELPEYRITKWLSNKPVVQCSHGYTGLRYPGFFLMIHQKQQDIRYDRTSILKGKCNKFLCLSRSPARGDTDEAVMEIPVALHTGVLCSTISWLLWCV